MIYAPKYLSSVMPLSSSLVLFENHEDE